MFVSLLLLLVVVVTLAQSAAANYFNVCWDFKVVH